MDKLKIWTLFVITNILSAAAQLPTSIPPINSIQNDCHAVKSIAGVHAIEQVKTELYLLSMNQVYLLHVDAGESGSTRIELKEIINWPSTTTTRNLCKQKTRRDDACNNFIRIFAPKNQSALEFIVCGSNSFHPMCRNYVKSNNTFIEKSEFSGTSICPYDPEHTGASLYAEGNLYAGTVADFLGRKPVIYRYADDNKSKSLERTKRNPTWLSDPWFIRLLESGPKVFILYTEVAMEDSFELVYSRVAQLCKNDQGGEHILRKQFTSFQKARLNCSFPGKPPFYFNEMKAATDFVAIPDAPSSKILFAAMNTPKNSIWGSAVCAYTYHDIENTFEKPFLEEKVGLNGKTYWSEIEADDTINNGLNKCLYDEEIAGKKFPSGEDLQFIRDHPFKSHSVQSWSGNGKKGLPLFMKLNSQYQFTAITSDTSAGSNGLYVVLLIGTTDGHVLKVIPKLSSDHDEYEESYVFVAEIQVYNKSECRGKNSQHYSHVRDIKIDRKSGFILVSFSSCIVSVPMCPISSSSFSLCKRSCIKAQDPYCAWDGNKCVTVLQPQGLEQDIINGDVSGLPLCHEEKTDGKEEPVNSATVAKTDDREKDITYTSPAPSQKYAVETHVSNSTIVPVPVLSTALTPGAIGFAIGAGLILLIIIGYCACKKTKKNKQHRKRQKEDMLAQYSSKKNPTDHNQKQKSRGRGDSERSDYGENVKPQKKESIRGEQTRNRRSESSVGSNKENFDREATFKRQLSKESKGSHSDVAAPNSGEQQPFPLMQKQYIHPSSTEPAFYRTFSMDNAGSSVMPNNHIGRRPKLQRNLSLQIPKGDMNVDHQSLFPSTTPVTYRKQNPLELYNMQQAMLGSPTVTMPSWQPMFANNASPVKNLQDPGRQYQTTSLDRKSMKSRFANAQLAPPNDGQNQGRNFPDTFSPALQDDKHVPRKRYQSESTGRPPPLYVMKHPAYSSIEEESSPLIEQGMVNSNDNMKMTPRPDHLPLMKDNLISTPYGNPISPMKESHPYFNKATSGYTLPAHLHRQSREISPTKHKQPLFFQPQHYRDHAGEYPYFVQTSSDHTNPKNFPEQKLSKSNPSTPEWDGNVLSKFSSNNNSSSNVRDRNPSGKSQGPPYSPVKVYSESDHADMFSKNLSEVKTHTPGNDSSTSSNNMKSSSNPVSVPSEKKPFSKV